MARPAYTRLPVDERRRRLLELGAELFARHPYDELSMRRIAREAGISKALLYHYFPSKQRFFAETLAQAAGELAARTAPDPDLPPAEALSASLDAFLAWVEENGRAYERLIRDAAAVPEVAELVDGVRSSTAERVLEGLGAEGPQARVAVHGWLWFMDGAILDWLEHSDITRDELRELLLRTLSAALQSSVGRT